MIRVGLPGKSVGAGVAALVLVSSVLLATLLFPGAIARAQDDHTDSSTEEAPAEDTTSDRLLAEGRVVYEANCMGCHQSDGEGISGVFPPLVDNDNVDDDAYVEMVIRQGREGEIVVAGVTYDGAMPAFTALGEEQIDAVIAFVQEGFDAPVHTPVAAAGPERTTEGLPLGTVVTYLAGFGIFAFAGAAVLGPVAAAERSNSRFSTLQTWLKAAVIFVYFTVATVFVPSMVVESAFLSSPPAVYLDLISSSSWGLIRDLIGTAVWLVALGFGLWALRRGQRMERL